MLSVPVSSALFPGRPSSWISTEHCPRTEDDECVDVIEGGRSQEHCTLGIADAKEQRDRKMLRSSNGKGPAK